MYVFQVHLGLKKDSDLFQAITSLNLLTSRITTFLPFQFHFKNLTFLLNR